MTTKTRTTIHDKSLRLRAEHRPEIDLDKLALALLSVVRKSTPPARREPGRG